MKRFNITSKGYKFDKVIFYAVTLILLLTIATGIHTYGLLYSAYFKCSGSTGMVGIPEGMCANPFYSEETYKCTWAFGLKKCNVKQEAWMNEKFLPTGEYGKKKPYSTGVLFFCFLALYIFALMLNHFAYNKGKSFHLNIFDKLEKIKLEDK